MIQIITGIVLVLLGIYVFVKYPMKNDVKSLVLGALFIILSIILKRLSIMVPLFGSNSLRIGFSLLPVILAGMILSPSYAFIIGVASDLLGVYFVPSGTIYLGFTLNSAICGVIPSLIVAKMEFKEKIGKYIIGGLIGLLITSGIYIFSLNNVTIDNKVVNLNIIDKSLVFIICTVMIGITLLVINKLKSKINNDNLHLFYMWILAVVLIELLVNFILTPLWLQDMFGIPFMLSLFVRVIKACIMIPLNIFIGYSVLNIIRRVK